jgi:hypothetical protein
VALTAMIQRQQVALEQMQQHLANFGRTSDTSDTEWQYWNR